MTDCLNLCVRLAQKFFQDKVDETDIVVPKTALAIDAAKFLVTQGHMERLAPAMGDLGKPLSERPRYRLNFVFYDEIEDWQSLNPNLSLTDEIDAANAVFDRAADKNVAMLKRMGIVK